MSNKSSLKIENEWLNTVEAAELLRVPEKSLRNMTSNGMITFYKLGRRNRYRREDLEALLLSNRKGKGVVDEYYKS